VFTCPRDSRESGTCQDNNKSGGNVHQRSVVRVGASLIIASLALSACGSRNTPSTSANSGNKTAIIGVMAPLSGDLSALGLGIQHSVELAVKQANANLLRIVVVAVAASAVIAGHSTVGTLVATGVGVVPRSLFGRKTQISTAVTTMIARDDSTAMVNSRRFRGGL